MFKSHRVIEFSREDLLGKLVLISFVDREGELLAIPNVQNPLPAFITNVTSQQVRFTYRDKERNREFDHGDDRVDDDEDDLPPEAFYAIVREGGVPIGEAWNEVNLENNPSQQQFRKITVLEH